MLGCYTIVDSRDCILIPMLVLAKSQPNPKLPPTQNAVEIWPICSGNLVLRFKMKLIFEKLDLIYLHAEPAQNGVQVVFNFSFTNRSKFSIFAFPPHFLVRLEPVVYETYSLVQRVDLFFR